MKGLLKGIIIVIVLVGLGLALFTAGLLKNEKLDAYRIVKWNVAWVNSLDMPGDSSQIKTLNGWHSANIDDPMPGRPIGGSKAWIEFTLPGGDKGPQAILLDKVYAQEVTVYLGDTKIYESPRNEIYDIKKVIVPFQQSDHGEQVYVGFTSSYSRIGLVKDEIKVGNYEQLQGHFVKKDVLDFVIGGALIFIAIIMLICLFFLNNIHLVSWLALSMVILSSGILIITYSTFLYTFYEVNVKNTQWIFDISLFVLLYSMNFFFEKIFGKGFFSIITIARRVHLSYSLFCFMFALFNIFNSHNYDHIYAVLTTTIMGYIMIIQFAILVSVALVDAIKGNMEGIIFSIGFSLLALLSLVELVWYLMNNQKYELVAWKWGLICFLISLIVILGKRFAKNHDQLVEYSQRLEIFNDEMQRSEKMEIISELAASVAHEVRNPLQVTRGFLQLLSEKQQSQDKIYLGMALEELDRASGIITDFLTFAKPEAGKNTVLNILNEFTHIEGILVPMANLQGGRITMDIPPLLEVKGNSSKFKQAFINIIKNSIEALQGQGEIQIWAYEREGQIYIHVKDNGEGMSAAELARLGEPYFSNKSKGTGLGLMVTYSIIDVMNGELTFKSEKGVGTEAIIRFPEFRE
ncbi:sensor histidine kinase [Paenibacillus sp. YPG26]|uniref:sensor histidine kinase n=1 Tax=Paenibacillus sp. YPG26 TaxID=2878915 RepID=UPI00203A7367|nr:sensor histidine kinase [Paenibacillus sp. YPG26]USB34005.1 sensor histidine kinase [Paenibacillus sp. YPG26]